MSAAAAQSANVRLMRLMGSPSGEFDPMPPSQYKAFLAVSRSEDLRVWAALLERTIGRADDGTRSAFAREAKGHVTKNKHLEAALDMHKSQVSEALTRLEADGFIKRSEGKIWLRADVPAPVMGLLREGEETAKRKICTVNLSAQEARHFNNLAKTDPERFHAAAVRLVAATEWDAKLQAAALAWAREQGSNVRNQVLTESGYSKPDTRGRKRSNQAADSDRPKPAIDFETFAIQRTEEIAKAGTRFTVQDGKLIPYTQPQECVQNAHPYGPESRVQSEKLAAQEQVNAHAETREAELRTKTPSPETNRATRAAETELKNEITACLHRARLTKLGLVAIDTGTLTTMARHLLRVPTAGQVREVIEVLEDRAREIKSGKRIADGWGYLVNVVKGECDKRDAKTMVKTAAAAKGMP